MGVLRNEAEEILAAIKELHPVYLEDNEYGQPRLREGDREGTWEITWECGPYEWALRGFDGGIDEETYYLCADAGMSRDAALKAAKTSTVRQPNQKTVFCEALTSYSLGLYPNY